MCVWNVAESDRLCQFCTYRDGCERYPVGGGFDINADGKYAIGIMNDIVGEDILRRCREWRLVWGRYIVAYHLYKMGYSYPKIGRAVGLSHSTAMHAVGLVTEMLHLPGMFEKEMWLWKQFQEKLNS